MDFINRLIYALTESHPIHAMVVHFPIALTGAAALFILLALWKKDDFFERAAFANIALAMLGTIIAALTGIYDGQRNYGGGGPHGRVRVILSSFLFLITHRLTGLPWEKPNLLKKAKIFYPNAHFITFFLSLIFGLLGGVILYGF